MESKFNLGFLYLYSLRPKSIVQFICPNINLRLKVEYCHAKLSWSRSLLTSQFWRAFQSRCCSFILKVILTSSRSVNGQQTLILPKLGIRTIILGRRSIILAYKTPTFFSFVFVRKGSEGFRSGFSPFTHCPCSWKTADHFMTLPFCVGGISKGNWTHKVRVSTAPCINLGLSQATWW